MPIIYKHPLTGFSSGQLGKPARLGLGYGVPAFVEAMVVYQAELCLRVQGRWVYLDDGLVGITEPDALETLETWYKAQADE